MCACAPPVFRFEFTDYISLSGRVKKVLFYYKNICMIPRKKQITGVSVVFPWNMTRDMLDVEHVVKQVQIIDFSNIFNCEVSCQGEKLCGVCP